ncbi:EAL domain-containing protein [Vibrio sp. JC009]|uniref:sensor domain-containing protein n=1 Tax=Vibrio sp. JC009 TaxID=2912314 RepID=UPI0023B0FE40|nr:EAL domain-containing protein [Vibrio sp. JC009]WED24323.1 EAL domain-containing protein [Vibrio sp. JC009]
MFDNNKILPPEIDAYRCLFSETKVPMLVISAGTGEIVDANQAACVFYGYEEEHLKTLNINQINQLTPSQISTEINKARTYKCNHFKFPHKLASGDIKSVEVYSHPISLRGETFLFSIIHDITSRVKAEEQLKLAAAVYDSTSEGILISNEKGQIIDANRAFTELTGHNKETILHCPCDSFLLGDQAESYRNHVETVNNLGYWRGEMELLSKESKLVPTAVTINRVFNEREQVRKYVHLITDISSYKELSEELSYLAHHDLLTQLPNRLMLFEKLDEYISRASRNSGLVYVIFIDLDGFKAINDTLGHPVGDALLVAVAKKLKEVIRSTDTVARFSGDEFVVVIEANDQPHEISQTLGRLTEAFQQPFCALGHLVDVTASIGVSKFPDDSTDANQLISYADMAMYDAKKRGRNQYCLFNADSEREIQHRTMVESALKEALIRDEFSLLFQPQVDIQAGECVGFEVLLRWRNSELDAVPPNIFILMAEQLGIMEDLGEWVIVQACRQAAKWTSEGHEFHKLAVNLSGAQLKSRRVCDKIRRALKDSGLDAAALELEVTESFIMGCSEETLNILDDLRAIGVSLAVDDFGTSFSSLSHLKRLPVDKIKIDREIINNIDRDEDGKVIAQSIIAMGQAMGLTVVAEGVETETQAAFLSENNCRVAQGYLYKKPMAPEQVVDCLTQNQ